MKKIAIIVSGLLVLGLGIFFLTNRTVGATLPVAGQTYTLAGSGTTGSATSITLSSLTIPQTGYELVDSDFSDTFYITFEPGSRQRQEIASCTTVTQNANNTATLSGCTRGLLPFTPFTASSSYQFAHGGGTSVIFSDPPQLFNQFTAKDNGEVITGQWRYDSYPTVTSGLSMATTTYQLVTKQYADSIANQGAATSTEANAGIAELATQAEMAASTDYGALRPLVLQAKYSTSTRTGTGNFVVITAGSGYVSSTFGGVAFSMATLNGSGLVVENPASASVTAGTSTIPITSSVTSSLSGSYFGTTTPGSVFYVGSDGFTTSLLNGVFGQVLKTNSTNTTTAMTAPEWAYSGLIFATTTNVSLSGSGTQTVLTTQIPANVLKRGSAIRVKGQISYSNSSGSNKTYSPAVQFGGGAGVCGFGGMLATSLGGSAAATFECVIQYVDATNQEGFGFSIGSDGNGVFTSTALGTGTTTPASAQNLSILNNTNTGTGEGSLNSLTIEVY